MDTKDIIIILALLFIPLILLVICYRNYTKNYCRNDMQCLQNKLLYNLNNLNDIMKEKKNELENILEKEHFNNNSNIISETDENENITNNTIEGFLGSLGNWFSSGSTPMPVTPGSLGNENLSILEKKINDKMQHSSSFPPNDTDDNKDSNNQELLNKNSVSNNLKKIAPSKYDIPTLSNNRIQQPLENSTSNIQQSSSIISNPISITQQPVSQQNTQQTSQQTSQSLTMKSKEDMIKDIFGSCQFHNDKCPDNYLELGNFSVKGADNNTMLSCGNVENIKPAHAIALIKNNSIYEIVVTDNGLGYSTINPPKIRIEGGKGNGATAEAIIDDNGYLKIIKKINPGYNYTETPNVFIDPPFMNSSCHLCCKL